MDLRTYQVLSLLSKAVLECDSSSLSSETYERSAKSLLHKCLTQLSRKREIHAQTAVRYLRGYQASILSHPSAPMLSGLLMAHISRLYMNDFRPKNDGIPSATDLDDQELQKQRPAVEQEQLTMSVDEFGNIFHVDQVVDYLHRDLSLGNVSFYMFSHAFTKRRKKKACTTQVSVDSNHTSVADAPLRAGSMPRFSLLSPHPQFKSHELILTGSLNEDPQTWKKIPRMIGTTIPRQTDTPRYYWFVLAHFKPFSYSIPLVTAEESTHIDSSFSLYPLSDLGKRVISNWEELCNCEDERDAERLRKMDQLSKESRLLSNSDLFGTNNGADLPTVDSFDSQFKDDVQNLEELERFCQAGYLQYVPRSNIDKDLEATYRLDPELTSTLDRELPRLSKIWDAELKSSAEAVASRRRNSSALDSQTQSIQAPETILASVQYDQKNIHSPPVRATISTSSDADTSLAATPEQIIEQVGLENKLNEQQWIAYRIIAKAFLEHRAHDLNPDTSPKPTPLRMLLTGPGGTGKTHIVNTVKQVMIYYGCEDRIRFLAPTGSAATLIDGTTIHSGLSIVTKKSNDNIKGPSGNSSSSAVLELSVKNKVQVRKELGGVYLIFCDEFSMVGLYLIAQFESACRYGKERMDEFFGGIIIIFSGDLYQFPPVKDRPVYSDIRDRGPVSDTELMIRLGKLAWNSITDVVELHHQHRMLGDPEYADAVRRLRTAECTQDNVDLFNSRVMKSIDNPGGVDLSAPENSSAIAIVPTNSLRQVLNVQKANSLTADKANRHLLEFEAFDEIGTSGKALPDVDGDLHPRDRLLKTVMKYKKGGSRQIPVGYLHLYVGMPVILKDKNISTDLRLTNGACGLVAHLSIREDGTRRILEKVFIYFPDCPLQLPHLPKGVVPISPITVRFHYQQQLSDGSTRNILIRRHQCPVQGGFAVTAHFVQGKTVPISTSSLRKGGAHAYVCASRPTTRYGIVLTNKISLHHLNRPCPAQLKREAERLKVIEHNTLVKHGFIQGPLKPLLPCFSSPLPEVVYNVSNDTEETQKSKRKHASKRDKKKPIAEKRPLQISDVEQSIQSHSSPPQKRIRLDTESEPTFPGVQWSVDWSCAYDSVIMTLYAAASTSPLLWTSLFSEINRLTASLSTPFQKLLQDPSTLNFNTCRDYLQDELSREDSIAFPRHGANAISVTSVLDKLSNRSISHPTAHVAITCSHCIPFEGMTDSYPATLNTLLHPSQTTISSTSNQYNLRTWISDACVLTDDYITLLDTHDSRCSASPLNLITLLMPPLYLFFEVQGTCTYRLCSIIYHGDCHFVSNLLLHGKSWAHDGQKNSGQCKLVESVSETLTDCISAPSQFCTRNPNVFFFVRSI